MEKLTEKQQLIAGYKKRIKFKKIQLLKTKKFHREEEAKISKRIKLDQIQLTALLKNDKN